ncbi:kinesin-like protein KIN-10C isoform X1 [Trifolium pratense]|uniref:kinesin-like protein KIN-10C isoform X1 n=1 Tax=Trifolium pratense TaxID=57577 RepID=UPI001E6912FC|nr:kinesin-like protein KIN-10C isoform X1 [Trifolium pratense]
MASNQFGFTRSNSGQKLRVIAKIRGFSDQDTNIGTVDWVSVNTENSGDVTISFKEQSSSQYSVDYCYKEHEDNEIIYSREVKPLVSAAFEGINSTVIAHGARGSGKTQLLQGSYERPGLALFAISEFLSMAEKNGKSIAVSFYEVDHQDHAVDLLNPEHPPILVLEDHGRIQFKGLTQTPVKSIAEFQNISITACSSHKAAPQKGFERVRRSHMGLIVHVFSQNETVDGVVSKMSFVDMAGYEDARRKSSDAFGHVENKQINKSIHTLLNVCHALSTNENRVPFRESKLTGMLQDSLRGNSKILLVSCLNPSFCQDTVYMVSLASRSRTHLDSTKKTASSTRPTTTLDSIKKSAGSVRQIVASDSTKESASSVRQTVASESSKNSASSVRQTVASAYSKKNLSSGQTVTLDSTKRSESSVRQTVASDSSMKNANSVRQTVTLDSTKRSESSVRQTVASDSSKKSASSVRQTVNLDSTKISESSVRQTVASDTSKKSASSVRPTVTLDSTKKTEGSLRQTAASDSSKKTASSVRQTVTSDSTKRSESSVRQTVASDSSKKSASSVRQTVNLDSTKRSESSVKHTVASDTSKKGASSVRQTVTLDSTKRSESSLRQTAVSDSSKKSVSSVRQRVTLDSAKKSASSARQTVALDSTKKSASSAIQTVTYRKNKVPKNVSATAKKLPGSISHTYENKVDVATKTEIKGRKLFDEASHSATKAEKEISIANASIALEPLLDNSLSEDGNHVELNSGVEKGNSLTDASNNIKLSMSEQNCMQDDSSLNASSEVELDPIVEKGISEDKEDIYTSYAINYSKDLSIADEGHNMNKENNNFMENGDFSPPISSQLRELQSLFSSTPLCMELPEKGCISLVDDQISTKIAEPRTPDIEKQDVMNTKSPWEILNGSEKQDVMNTKSPWETFNIMHGSGMENSTEIKEPRTPDIERRDVMNTKSPWETFNVHGSGMKNSLVKDYLRILNTAEKDELKKLKGIGEKRATYILELREESPEPFKSLDDLKDIGLSEKQIKGMMKKEIGELFN